MALKNTQGVTDSVFYHILKTRKSIAGIFESSFDELYGLELNSVIVDNIIAKKFDKAFIDKELAIAEKNNVQILTIECPEYPKLLKEISSPPPYIYTKGSVSVLNEPTIAIVGSRKCSAQSEVYTRRLAADLAEVGFTVISGFAYGVDIKAHLGASAKGATAAVLGNGFLHVYPKDHLKYSKNITDNGCFVTEFPFNEPPIATNFPRRNRIISGLSLGVVVIEASIRSGSLITAKFATEQNREVFAVPHFPGSYNSAGNLLIKQGAKLVETHLDIVSEFAYHLKSSFVATKKDNELTLPLFDNALKHDILQAVMVESLNMNELCVKLNTPITDIMASVTELELEGYLLKEPTGKYFADTGGFDNG